MKLLSPYLIAIVLGWLFAHAIKYVIAVAQNRQLDFTHQLFISGGMPSSHASTSLAAWTVILMRDGVDSGLFGLATLVVLIICYDAVKVRRSVGEQGEAIAELIKNTKNPIALPRAAKGHTPLELTVGALLGIAIGYVVFLATK